MILDNLFPFYRPRDPSADCSAEAHDKVDVKRLSRLVEQEYLLFKDGAIADEISGRLQMLGYPVDEFSIRPRVSELKEAGTLVPTGARRENRRGNSCAVLRHSQLNGGK